MEELYEVWDDIDAICHMDSEWVNLMREAREIGLSKEDIRTFIVKTVMSPTFRARFQHEFEFLTGFLPFSIKG